MGEFRKQHNQEEIKRNWGKIKQGVTIDEIIDTLIEESVVSIEKWLDIKDKREKDKVEEVLRIIWQKPRGIPIFHRALKNNNHGNLADSLNIIDDSGKPVRNIHFLFYFTQELRTEEKKSMFRFI